MSKNLVTVWNSSPGIVKVGEDKVVLKPANSMQVERTAAINSLIDAGKLVVLSNIKDENSSPAVEAEPVSRKKAKKDTAQEDLNETTETEISEENQQETPIENTEVSEDSILPEETV